MRTLSRPFARALRGLAHAAIVALGVLAVVGSGGGFSLGFPDIDFDGPFAPAVSMDLSRRTVQVGESVTFQAMVFGTPPLTYRWRRNGVDIPGAQGASYTLSGANLADDGATFSLEVRNTAGTATDASLLWVSALPPVVAQDGEFADARWQAQAVGEPAAAPPVSSASQAEAGGSPGAFRRVAYTMPAGLSSIRVFHVRPDSGYDPAVLGAIRSIDVSLDCSSLTTAVASQIEAAGLLEQAGRRYRLREQTGPCLPYWTAQRSVGLLAEDFTLVTGPACAAGERCPDFSASAAPIAIGFLSSATLATGTAAGSVLQGVDNWKVTIWRR